MTINNNFAVQAYFKSKKTMEDLINQFPVHLKTQLETHSFDQLDADGISNVVILGMGGSGIGGRIVQSLVSEECSVPIIIVNNYAIPGFVNQNSLVIASSYSGNTEETLAAFRKAQEKKARLAAITSGGKMEALCNTSFFPYVKLPGGYPAPRACLGFSTLALLKVLNAFGLIGVGLLNEMGDVSDFLINHQSDIRKLAKEVAESTHGKMKVLYAENDFAAVLVRWAQQINENAKELALHHTIPEMNHNEIVGWESENKEKAVIYLRNRDDLERNQKRMDIMRVTIEPNAASITEIEAQGKNFMEKLFYSIHLGDYLSLEMSILNEVDVMSIESINHLKGELAKL